MKVAMLGHASNGHARRWARVFAEAGHDVHLLTERAPREPLAGVRVELVEPGLIENIRVFRLDGGPLAWNRHKHRTFAPRIARIAPDLVFAHEALGYGVVLPHVRGAAKVLMPWGSDVLVAPHDSPEARALVREALLAADVVTGNAPGLEDHLRTSLDAAAARMDLFAWGVDLSVFHPEATRDAARIEQACGTGALPFLFAPRRFTRALGAEAMLDAWDAAGLAEAAQLIVLGGGEADPACLARARKTAGVVAIGRRLDAASMQVLYRKCCAAVSVPQSDFLALSVQEATACGAPLILSPLPAYRAAARAIGDGWHATLAEDTAALAEAMRGAVRRPYTERLRIAESQRTVAVHHFDARAGEARMLALLEAATRNRGAR